MQKWKSRFFAKTPSLFTVCLILKHIKERRPGDIATCYADPAKSRNILGWTAKYDQTDMCRDTWNWQSQNPDGYLK